MLPPHMASCRPVVLSNSTIIALAEARSETTRRTRGRSRHIAGLWATLLAALFVVLAGQAGAQATDYLVAGNGSCVSNDVRPVVGNVTVIDICDGSAGDTVTVDFGLNLINGTNTTRYDILFGFSDGLVGGTPHVVTSSCALESPAAGTTALFNQDGQADCYDLNGSASQSLTSSATFQCDEIGDAATLELSPITGWSVNNSNLLTGSDPISGPKCFVEPSTVTIPLGAKINLSKISLGGTGAFGFGFTGTGIDQTTIVTATAGVATDSGANIRPNSYSAAANGGAGGYTAPVVITEAVPNGWSLTGISCEDAAAPGTEIGTFDAASASYTIPAAALAVDQTINCTATNDNRGTIEITKIVNDGGTGLGEAASTWGVGYVNSSDSSITGSANGTITALVPAGSYNLREVLVGGLGYAYDAVVNCGSAQASVPVVSNGAVFTVGSASVTAGTTTSCTITNTLRTATLTVQKNVANGGALGTLAAAADWTVAYDGPDGNDGSGAGSVGPVTVPVGAYTLSETELSVPAGLSYSRTGLACTSGTLNGDTVTLTSGQTAVCTFTNTLSTATLTLEKAVVDTNDIDPAVDTDWALTFTGPSGATGTDPEGDPEVTGVVVPAGAYTLSETGPTNYDLTAIACTGSDSDGLDGLTLADGEAVTCELENTITQARLSVTKVVVNASGVTVPGADAWRMGYTGSESFSKLSTASAPISNLVAPGPYTLTEQLGGNSLTYDVAVSCSGATATPVATSVSDAATNSVATLTLAAGDDVSCTVTNTLRTVDLTLVKTVDSGALTVGTTVPGDWDLSFQGPASGTVSTGTTTIVPVGDYTFSEASSAAGAGNYTLDSLSCNGADATGGYSVAADTTCTFANVANVAQVTLVKAVSDAGILNSEVLPADQWELTLGGATGTNGTANVTDVLVDPTAAVTLSESAGAHDLSYSTGLACTGGGSLAYTSGATSGELTVSAGDNVTCTFTNTLEAGSLQLVKSVPANSFGVVADDWDLRFDAVDASNSFDITAAGDTGAYDVPAGDYTISETLTGTSDAHATYVLTSLVCTADTAGDVLDLSGSVASPITTIPDITVPGAKDVVCTFTNETNAARLTLTKAVTGSVDAGTVPPASSWTIATASGPTPISGVTGSGDVTDVLVSAGTYDITESFAASLLSYDVSLACSGNATAETDLGATVTTGGTVGSLTIAAGETVSCEITNAVETATLTLEKFVAANALGVEDTGWDLSFDGPGSADRTGVTGTTPVSSVVVPAGVYTLDEVQNASATDDDYALYGLDSLVCGTTDVTSSKEVTLAQGDDVTCVFTNAATQGRLTLVKTVDDSSVAAGTTVPAATAWTLSTSGTTPISGVTGTADVTNVAVTAGSYTISEVIPGGVLGYDAALSCTGAAGGFTDAGATVTGAASADVGSVEVGVGENVVCTIDNTLETATLTLVKSVDNGDFGTAAITDWDLRFDGPGDAGAVGETGATEVTSVVVPAGAYTLTEENGPANYTLSSLVCTGTDQNGADGLTLLDDETVTCTFQNDITVARVTLNKVVNNPASLDGVALDADSWALSVDGGAAGNNGDASVTDVLVTPGDIALTESAGSHDLLYSSALSCSGATNGLTYTAGATSGLVGVEAGDDVECTFVNTLQTATLTLVKEVAPNALGVTADGWNLTFDGLASSGVGATGQTGSGAVTTVTIPAGDYALSEALTPAVAGDIDYQQYGIESLICEIDGNATPDLKSLSAPQLSVADGETAICTFVNAPNTAKVTLVKTLDVPAAYAGLATPAGDWVLEVGTNSFTSTAWASQNIYLTPGDYDLSEANDGESFLYDASISCTNGDSSASASGTLTITDGQVGSDITCTFANRLETATLTLVKEVENGAVSTDVDSAADWDLTYAGPEGITGTAATGGADVTSVLVPAGDFSLSELGTGANADAYALSSLVCTGGSDATGANGLTLVDGEDVTCTFVNTLQRGELTLVKEVVNDNGGTFAEADFTLSYNGTAAVQGTPVRVAAGDYVLTEALVDGYTRTGLSCVIEGAGGSSFAGDTLSLVSGDAAVCTFVNDDVAPTYDMVKSASPDLATVGEVLTFSFAVTNDGPWTISNIAISDPLPGLSAISCPSGANPIASLAAGATETCTATYTVTQEDVDGAGVSVSDDRCASGRAIQNSATSSAEETDGTPLTETDDGNNDAYVCLPGAEPLITVEKSVDITSIPASEDAVGQVLTYTIEVQNPGNVTLTDVTLTDVLRTGAGVDISAELTGPTLVSGDDGNGDLDVGETWTYEATHTVTQADLDSGRVVNTVRVAAEAPSGAEITDGPSRAVTTLGRSSDIALEKTGTLNDDDGVAGVSAGDTISYDFTIENTGNVTLSAVTLSDLVAGVSLSATDLGTLAPGATATATGSYTLTQADIDAGSFTNTAEVTGTGSDGSTPTDQDDDVRTLGQVSGIALEKTADYDGSDAAQVGDEVSYLFTVENTGNVTLTGVTLTDSLIEAQDGVLATLTLTGGDADDDGALDVGETWTYVGVYALTQADIDAGEVLNSATVAGTPPTGDPVTDDDDVTVDLPQGPELTLEKSGRFNDENDDGFAEAGETVTYTFTVENTGNVTVSNIALTDELITGLTNQVELRDIAYVSGDEGEDRVIRVTQAGESPEIFVYTATYALTQEDIEAGIVENVAVVTGTDPKDTPVEDDSDDPDTPEVDDPTVEILPAEPKFDISVEVAEPEVTVSREVNAEDGTTTLIPRNQDEIDADPSVAPIWSEPDSLTYTITVPNTGQITLVNPTLDFTVVQSGDVLVPSFRIDPDGTVPDAVVNLVRSASLTGGDTDGDGQLDVGEIWEYTVVVIITEDLARRISQPGRDRIDGIGTFDADDIRPDSAGLDSQSDDDTTEVIIELTQATGETELAITKRVVGRDTVRQGDVVTWEIGIINSGETDEILDVVDSLPGGFLYRGGSLDGLDDEGRLVSLDNLSVDAGETVTFTIDTVVLGSTQPGLYTNRVTMVDDEGNSYSARATVVVGPEPVFDCGTVIGKVFDDVNQNGYQDGPSSKIGLATDRGPVPAGMVVADDVYGGGKGKGAKYTPPPAPVRDEKGIPGVRLVTVKGEIITTDEHGRFHVPCAALPRDIGTNFTLKLDTRSLPSGYRLTTENPRVIRLTAGKMTKMNFGATISKLVRIDIADNAFVPGTNQPKPAFVQAMGRAVPKFADIPVTVRISYVEKGESGATMARRMRAVEGVLRGYWKTHGKYRLMVEKTVQHPR
ncbi:DUF7507 domain-containing protein [Litorisediminicola beolgyonensis]|uniref:Uncharacterized protein n=1 Tax=Litorisediminicola beolgyonensis TaxID=1173614 RepID=A0ABW3ZML4_9RHOB